MDLPLPLENQLTVGWFLRRICAELAIRRAATLLQDPLVIPL